LEPDHQIKHHQEANRRMLLFVISGELLLNNQQSLSEGDSARITELEELNLSTSKGTQFILIDLA
jgi:redox-sensitive bicupin YhaK (pirin superfamily)